MHAKYTSQRTAHERPHTNSFQGLPTDTDTQSEPKHITSPEESGWSVARGVKVACELFLSVCICDGPYGRATEKLVPRPTAAMAVPVRCVLVDVACVLQSE